MTPPLSCSDCQFALFADVGYSNYTVEGTEFYCTIGLHPEDGFDRFYGGDKRLLFAQECKGFMDVAACVGKAARRMTIYFLSPGSPETQSGGTRKIYDLCAILNNNGFESRVLHYSTGDQQNVKWKKEDVVVVPEVFGIGMDQLIPRGVRRVGFAQNPFLITRWGVPDPVNGHPYAAGNTPDLIAVLTESELTSQKVREQCPDISVPIIRTHSSGNGRNGKDAGFFYGLWPREKRVIYFQYKHEDVNKLVFDGLELPPGWELVCLTGMSDAEVARQMRTAAIFASANFEEGMCAPTSEALISGCVNVCWTGEGPDEYLIGRAVIARQDHIDELRSDIVSTAEAIDREPEYWADHTKEWSEWFQWRYSRQNEIDEIVGIFEGFGCRRKMNA